MAFTAYPNPDFISKFDGTWVKGPPADPTYPHHTEVDLDAGLIGYTRLTAAELTAQQQAAQAAQAAAQTAATAAATAATQQAIDVAAIKAKALVDPAYAALVRILKLNG